MEKIQAIINKLNYKKAVALKENDNSAAYAFEQAIEVIKNEIK